MRLGVLASGGLGLAVLKDLVKNRDIGFVMTDSQSEGIIEFCKTENIQVFTGNPRNGRAKDFLVDRKIDVMVSVNYLFLIEKDLIEFPEILSFNIHGSLLPRYRGRTPHVWSIINNEKQTGITAHIIDEGCDTGDILDQIVIPIDINDTGSDVLVKYESAYLPLINGVLDKIKTGKIIRIKQDNTKASYFGKRTPEDGRIDWNWQKERIYNWVRAQAKPYPGAFTYLDGEKIIIDKIEFDDWGFTQNMNNGLILTVDPIRVKTPNGVVQLKELRKIPENMGTEKLLN